MEYLLWVLVALVAYAMVAPLTSATTQEVPASVVLFLSTAVFLALTLVVLLVTNNADPGYALDPAAGYIYVAGLFLGVGILSYFTALERGPVSVVVPIYGMFIVGSSVIGIAFLDEALSATRVAGIACAVLAIYLSAGGEPE
jgi:transporter family protein